MAAAEVLWGSVTNMRRTVSFCFQPAEENLPRGEIGGAKRMIDESAFANPKPSYVIFGLHMISSLPAGTLGYRPGRAHASTDEFRITIPGGRRTAQCRGEVSIRLSLVDKSSRRCRPSRAGR